MKSKPNVNIFKKDPTSFLDGGNLESMQPQLATEVKPKKESSETFKKLIAMPFELNEAIKDRAYAEFKKTGRRVTEMDLIMRALEDYFCVSK